VRASIGSNRYDDLPSRLRSGLLTRFDLLRDHIGLRRATPDSDPALELRALFDVLDVEDQTAVWIGWTLVEETEDLVGELGAPDQRVTLWHGSDMDWLFWRRSVSEAVSATATADFFPSVVLPAYELGWILYSQPAEMHARCFVEPGSTGDLSY
jgi:hypothetical protein